MQLMRVTAGEAERNLCGFVLFSGTEKPPLFFQFFVALD